MTKLASSLNNAASSKAPSGWEPYTETHGDQIGEAIVRLPSPNSTARDLLVTAGFDPDCWRIDGLIDTRKWMRYDQEWLYYYKFKVKAGESPEAIEVHVDELTKLIRKRGRWARRTVTGGDDAFAFFMSDLQIGKREGEIGTPQIVERYLEALDMAVGRVKELRRIGRKMPTIALIGLGDVVEGCFAAETPVVTSRGIRPIVDLAHEGSATIRTAYGRWVDAEFRSFGRQRLVRLELVRQNERRTVFTTAEHRWFKLSNPSSNSAKIELNTSDLAPGDFLAATFGRGTPSQPSFIGIQHGAVWGDGHRDARGSAICLYGPKADDLLPYFAGARQSGWKGGKGREVKYVEVSGLPAFFKDSAPDLSEDRSYLLGFLAGLIATDGSVSKREGSVTFCQASRERVEYVRDLCSVLGIGTTQVREAHTTAGNVGEGTLYGISLVKSTVPRQLFVRPEQLDRWDAGQSRRPGYVWQRNRARCWQVVSVEPTDRIEEVFCAVVPETHAFCLDGDILTGNCTGNYPKQRFVVDCNDRDQNRIARELIATTIDEFLPLAEHLVVACVAGNHGENRQGGEQITDDADNRDVSCFEAVKEAYDRVGADIDWVIPQDELSMQLSIGGTDLAIAHGHKLERAKGGTPAAKAMDWWKGQDFGFNAIRGAQVLVTGHFHHFLATQAGSRTHIQCPAMDPGSKWFSDTTGEQGLPGIVTMRLDGEAPMGYDDLKILVPSL